MKKGLVGLAALTLIADQKFLDETAGLRKELNEKKGDYFEAIRHPNTDPETVAKLEQELGELQDKLYAKARQGSDRGYGRPCWHQ